jgi:hypothetical protein
MTDYDADIVLWSEHQAALLRRLSNGEPMNEPPDRRTIAEEIGSVGRSERSALASHIRVVLEHLAKRTCPPATEPRTGWRQTVLRARAAIQEILEASTGLRPSPDAVIA